MTGRSKVAQTAPAGRRRSTSEDYTAEAEDTRTQAQKFADAAREHGADQDEEAFKGVLRKLAKRKS